MDSLPFVSNEIRDRSFIAFLKREIHNTASKAGFSESRVGVIDIVVAELTSNIIKHAGKGELLYRFSTEKSIGMFEVFGLDNGPGMRDISHSMKDGVTTTKSLGQGLGAMKRLSDSFHIYSIMGWGTVCYAKIFTIPDAFMADPTTIKFRALNVSKPGQAVSGDGFEVTTTDNHTSIFVGDGLGHGKEAHDAVQLAIANFKLCTERDPAKILAFIHDPLKKTRGLVATAVTVDHRMKKWRICGIGNVATRLYEGIMIKNYVSYNGIIGLRIPNTVKNHEADLGQHQSLVMTTDGINTRWALSQFPSILRYDPFMLAGAIYKECSRKNDDVSILVART